MRALIAATLIVMAATVSARPSDHPAQLEIHPLDADDLSSAAPWQFLASILGNVNVMSLPEPIHMTHEFPMVRLGILKFLNEQMGFHVLAMEGSLVDAWATQDRFLASAKSDRDAEDAQLALFPLWNTPEVRQLFQYEAASWATRTPLYITAYDVQPGTGKGTQGIEAFRLLADRLARYASAPASLEPSAWLRRLQPLTGACHAFAPANIPAVRGAIEQLESWIAAASPAVEARFPGLPVHAASLRLLPVNLRSSLALCSGVAAAASGGYKALRDREGAAFAEQLRAVSADKKLVLWAHWSHLTYHDPMARISVGQELRHKLGTRLYTILPLAERGTAIVIFPNRASDDDIGFGWVRPGSDPFANAMRALSSTPFFLNLQDPAVKNDDAFVGAQRVWVESRAVRVPLTQTTDAIVWLKRVSPPDLSLPLLMILGGMHYRTTLAVSASLLIVLSLSALVWRWGKYRNAGRRT